MNRTYMEYFHRPYAILVFPVYNRSMFTGLQERTGYRAALSMIERKRHPTSYFEYGAEDYTLRYILSTLRDRRAQDEVLAGMDVFYLDSNQDGFAVEIDIDDEEATLMSLLSVE